MNTIAKGENLNVWKKQENLNQFFEGCKELGVHVIGINHQNFLDKDRTSMLGIIW